MIYEYDIGRDGGIVAKALWLDQAIKNLDKKHPLYYERQYRLKVHQARGTI